MNETKEGRIVLRHNGKDGGSVRIECTKAQAANMTYKLLTTLRDKSRDVYESVMEAVIREDLVGEDIDEEVKDLYEFLFGGK